MLGWQFYYLKMLLHWFFGLYWGLNSGLCTLEPGLQPFFAVVILEIRSCFLPKLAWIAILLYFTLSAVAGMADMHHHTKLFFC
jgi:hypothetical protein